LDSQRGDGPGKTDSIIGCDLPARQREIAWASFVGELTFRERTECA